jgi:hypothetical protein
VSPITSESGRKRRAAYMRSYREAGDDYRTREREAARRRRGTASPAAGVVTEAESGGDLARVYVVPGPGPAIRLHVVTDAGLSVILGVLDGSEATPVAS